MAAGTIIILAVCFAVFGSSWEIGTDNSSEFTRIHQALESLKAETSMLKVSEHFVSKHSTLDIQSLVSI